MQLVEGLTGLEGYDYDERIINFAQLWAERMEAFLAEGEPLHRIIGLSRVSVGAGNLTVEDQLNAQQIILESWLYGQEMREILDRNIF